MSSSEGESASAPWLAVVGDAVEIEVLAVPRASRSRVVGVHEDRLKIQLAAPPVDGEANAALVTLLAKLLRVRKSAVSLVSGHGSKRKRVRVEGVDPAAVRALASG